MWRSVWDLHNQGQRPEDSVNPVPTEHGGVQPICTKAPGYRKCTKTIFDWTVPLFISYEVGCEIYSPQLNNLIGRFKCTMVQLCNLTLVYGYRITTMTYLLERDGQKDM